MIRHRSWLGNAFSTTVFSMLVLTGCARMPLAPPQASVQTLELTRSYDIAPINVGEFVLAPGKSASLDQTVSLRGSTLYSPYNESFSNYLREVLVTELRTAGKYDPNSATVIRGWLTVNEIDASGINVGNGSIGARFVVNRDSAVVYEREHVVSSEWESSFAGVSAISAAVNEYATMYRKLVRQLFGDETFRNAVR